MSAEQQESVYALMWEVRKLTRSSLLFQHVVAKRMGLHVTDAECIDFLQERGPSSAGELAKATGLTTGAITSVIDRLEKAGFVKRQPDPKDRRKVIVHFVSDRHKGAKADYGAMAAEVYKLFSGYSVAELRFLVEHTKVLAGIYQGQVRRLEEEK